jgi:magnesium chelatase family protein
LGHSNKRCVCLPGAIIRYRKRLSGPLLDRIDLHADVPPVEEKELTTYQQMESSRLIQERITKAHLIQEKRFKQDKKVHSNGEMTVKDIKTFCKMTENAVKLLQQAVSRLSLSARSYFKMIKVAQTIADLGKSPLIDKNHVGEALQYRLRED